ncbi:hypothetical protein [Burkholderia stabilis]|uniref:hypothetical protein n=1 Tax=Burkholderia stabilis TaxID=95485 RepID=UPI001F4AA7B5|nr:hypothetical protein [Burkholderia stabilis]
MGSKEAADVTIVGDAVVVTPGIGMSLAVREAMTSRIRRGAGEVIFDLEGTLCERFYEADDRITSDTTNATRYGRHSMMRDDEQEDRHGNRKIVCHETCTKK